MIIYLLGLPSSGKSTLGKKVAHAIGYEFLDLDTAIEAYSKMSIPEIFKAKGEEGFRKIEKTVLEQSSKGLRLLIATGGGAPCFYNNMEFMLNKGETIYLDITVDEIIKRLISVEGQEGRPLLKGKGLDDLRVELLEKKKIRDVFYKKAKHIITNDNIQVNDILRLIVK